MEKLKLGEWGERLKIGGAQMSRKVSGKMKEILQVQTPEGKLVDEATSDRLEEPDWAINLRIFSLLTSEEFSGQEVVKAIKKKIACKNQQSQRLSLELLEACAMNCEKVFSEIASEKVLDEMVRLIDDPLTHFGTRQRALQLIQAWGESSDLGYLPVFQQTYMVFPSFCIDVVRALSGAVLAYCFLCSFLTITIAFACNCPDLRCFYRGDL